MDRNPVNHHTQDIQNSALYPLLLHPAMHLQLEGPDHPVQIQHGLQLVK